MFTRSVFLAAVVVAAAICGGELDILHAAFDRTAADVVFACTANAQVAYCDRNYTVVAGDFCDGISAKENVSTYQLATVNADKIDVACDNLALGEVRLPFALYASVIDERQD